MKRKQILLCSSVIIVLSILVSACQSGGTVQFKPLQVAAQDCTYGGEISKIRAVSEFQVEFTLCYPDPAFTSKIANPVFSIQKQDVLDATKGNSAELSKTINGTGPYILSDATRSSQIILKANPTYWGTPPRSNLLVVSWVASPFQRLNMLTNKLADVIDSPDPTNYIDIQNNTSLELHVRPSLNIFYIGFNNTVSPFTDGRIRQALSLAIDRSYMVNNFFPVGSELANQFVPATVQPGYTAGLRWYDFNIGDAKNQLSSAGFDFNQNLDFYFDTNYDRYSPVPADTAAYIKEKFKEAGINVVLHAMQTADFQAALQAGTIGFFMTSFRAGYPDASGFYNLNFLDTNKALGTPLTNLSSEIEAAGKATDPGIRQSHYDVINRLIKDLVPVIPIAYIKNTIANRITVENVVAGSFSEDFTDMGSNTNSVAYVQEVKPVSYWPGDETDLDTLRIANLLYDTLVRYDFQTNAAKQNLSDFWKSNENATVWTFDLRTGVKFTNGEVLNANDVVATFTALWDASSPNHTGNTGQFEIFQQFFGNFINVPVEP